MAENQCDLHLNDRNQESNHFLFIFKTLMNTTVQNMTVDHVLWSSSSCINSTPPVIEMAENSDYNQLENEKSATKTLNPNKTNGKINTHYVMEASNA